MEKEMPQELIRFFEKSINWILPGCQLFYRDTDADIDVQKSYQVGSVIRAGFFTIAQNSMRPYRMQTWCAGGFARSTSIRISRSWMCMKRRVSRRFSSFTFLIKLFRSSCRNTHSISCKALPRPTLWKLSAEALMKSCGWTYSQIRPKRNFWNG